MQGRRPLAQTLERHSPYFRPTGSALLNHVAQRAYAVQQEITVGIKRHAVQGHERTARLQRSMANYTWPPDIWCRACCMCWICATQ